MPKVNAYIDNENDYIIETVSNNIGLINDDVDKINNLFSYYQTAYFKENYSKKVITPMLLDEMLSSASKSIYYSYDFDSQKLDEEKLRQYYKNDFKYYYEYMLGLVIEGYKGYNYSSENIGKEISIKEDEIKEFSQDFLRLFNNIYQTYTSIELPSVGGLEKKDLTNMYENLFKFNVYEKKAEVNLNNLDSESKFNLVKNVYSEANARLKNKPKLLDNKERDVIKDSFNVKVNENYLIKIRESYKEIERIHASRPWYHAISHMYSYLKEKRYMSKILSSVKKIYKNTLYMDRVEEIIKGSSQDYQVKSLHLDQREANTKLLCAASETLFGASLDKFGIDIDSRDYLEGYKPRVKKTKDQINQERVNISVDEAKEEDQPRVYYRDITIKTEKDKYKEL